MANVSTHIIGNWKMYGDPVMARELAAKVASYTSLLPASVEVVLCPPAVLMGHVRAAVAGSSVKIGGQDCHTEKEGAYTGDISAAMLREAGCTHVIVGHSERRALHNETSADVNKKTTAALAAGLIPIICVGETLKERQSGKEKAVVKQQIVESVPKEAESGHFMLAYEPVWAIGSGKTPTALDISQMHAHIRSVLGKKQAPVLYGGSVKAANAKEILATKDVAGVLVGGASVKAEEFCKIVASGR